MTTWGSRGDVEPLAGLGAALKAAGAEAQLCAPPDGELEAVVRRAGIEYVPFGQSVRDVVTSGTADPFQVAEALVAARFESLGAVAPGAGAIVATGLMPAGVRSVAEKLGLRYVLACFHPYSLPSPHYPPSARPGKPIPEGLTDNRALWRIDAERVDDLYGPAHNRHREAIGLPPIDNHRDHVFTDRPWLAADPILCPADGLTDLEVVQTGAWILSDHRALPDEVEAFLAAGEPPVYVGFGSLAMRGSPDLPRIAIEAARAHRRRLLLSGGWAGLRPVGEEEDCLQIGEANHQALFRRVAAVVHHGGAGTTHTAALAGAPQVIVPQFVDQPHWARRVAELGIGAAHDGASPTVESLTAALAIALAPQTRERARAVAAEMRTDGAAVAAQLLLETTPLSTPAG